MFEDRDDMMARIIGRLREPVAIDPAFDARVMRAVGALPVPTAPARRPLRRAAPWLAAAAALAALLIARPWDDSTDAFRFELLAPEAASVALVGDFNDWDPARTPMTSLSRERGVWAAELTLGPGRYRYAFLVDGRRWQADPQAPAAMDDGFGTPSSVLTVERNGAGS